MDRTGTHDGLRYIGRGTAIIDVPARDLTGEEVKRYGRNRLLLSGLYQEYETTKKVYVPKPSKSALKGGTEETAKE